MLRRASIFATALALGGTTAADARVNAPAPVTETAPASAFFVSGRGWGHGIGMSQWGAYGFAQRGARYDQILAHYYRGTSLGRAPIARIRVLLGEGKRALAIASDTAFTVRDGAGAVHRLEPGAHSFGPAFKLRVQPDAPARALPGPLLFSPGGEPLRYAGKAYRGQLRVDVVRKRLQLVNHLGLEPYLYGVVPREVPFHWHPEALKAQAVVARSYALAVRKTGSYDVYADTRSQVYGGIAAERPSTNAAVDATAGQVLFYEGTVATTFFFSTSGGRTAAIEDVWANGTPTPYLVSVPDPYETESPHHSWGPFSFTGAKLRSAFKVPGQLLDVRVTVNKSQRVDTVTLVGTKGEVVVPGADVRAKLGLRSTWFRVGVLALQPPAKAVEFGSAVRLTGIARGAGSNVRLERRVSGQAWESIGRVVPGAAGAIEVAVRPTAATSYRLAVSAKVFGPPVAVKVAPRVRLQPITDPATLRGVMRPVVPGARVAVQRLEGSAWRVAGTATVDAAGAFEASVALTPGTYRARVVAGRGLVPGVSPVVRVLG